MRAASHSPAAVDSTHDWAFVQLVSKAPYVLLTSGL
jgi:hypothetical protein